MPHFVYDTGTLNFPKADLVSVPGGADVTKYVRAVQDYNPLCQAVVDIQSQLQGAKAYGLSPQASDPLLAWTAYLWPKNDGTLQYKYAGVNKQVLIGTVPTAGQVLFGAATGFDSDAANFWDNTNKRQGYGTNVPETLVHLHGASGLRLTSGVLGAPNDIKVDPNNGTHGILITTRGNVATVCDSDNTGNNFALWHKISQATAATMILDFDNARLSLAGTNVEHFLNGTATNRVRFKNVGLGAPSFTTRSQGTKLALWDDIDASHSEYGMGVETLFMWYCVSDANGGYKWYAGTTEVMRLTGAGHLTPRHVIGGGSTPGIAAGPGAGTAPTIAIAGTDMAGTITLTAGTSPATGATIATITFAVAYGAAPRVIVSPANKAARDAAVETWFHDQADTTTTVFLIKSGSTGLTASTQYKWNFHVIQ